MDDKAKQPDGPSMLHYVEQRFGDIKGTTELALKSVDDRFKHLEQLFTLGQENAKRAVDKAEATQAAHNAASNEWRGTLNDFKATLVGRTEFERFYSEFSAYRLEQSRQTNMTAGAKQERTESKEDWKSLAAILIAVASIVVAFFAKHF